MHESQEKGVLFLTSRYRVYDLILKVKVRVIFFFLVVVTFFFKMGSVVLLILPWSPGVIIFPGGGIFLYKIFFVCPFRWVWNNFTPAIILFFHPAA